MRGLSRFKSYKIAQVPRDLKAVPKLGLNVMRDRGLNAFRADKVNAFKIEKPPPDNFYRNVRTTRSIFPKFQSSSSKGSKVMRDRGLLYKKAPPRGRARIIIFYGCSFFCYGAGFAFKNTAIINNFVQLLLTVQFRLWLKPAQV